MSARAKLLALVALSGALLAPGALAAQSEPAMLDTIVVYDGSQPLEEPEDPRAASRRWTRCGAARSTTPPWASRGASPSPRWTT